MKKFCLVFFTIMFFYLTIFFVSYSIFDKKKDTEYIFLNNYVLKKDKHITKLSNTNKDYIFKENFPRAKVLKYSYHSNILLLECESYLNNNENVYYKIDLLTDEIIGPISKEQFVKNLKDYINLDFLCWER